MAEKWSKKLLFVKHFNLRKIVKKISLQFDDIFSQNEEIANFYLRKIMKKKRETLFTFHLLLRDNFLKFS